MKKARGSSSRDALFKPSLIESPESNPDYCTCDIADDIRGAAVALIVEQLDHLDAARQDEPDRYCSGCGHCAAQVLTESEKPEHAERDVDQ